MLSFGKEGIALGAMPSFFVKRYCFLLPFML